ncbi:MAG: sensor histidine kinase [Halobacteriales archaeon]
MEGENLPTESLFDVTPDPVVAYVHGDGGARATAANTAFHEAFDPEEPVEGRKLEAVLHTGDAGSFVDRIDGGDAETVVAHPADDDRALRLRAVSTDDGAAGYAVYTEAAGGSKRVRELEERIDRLDQLVSVVVHDLRNPLEVAEIRLEAARQTGEGEHFEKIAAAHDRIDELIDDLRETARDWDEIGETERLDVEDAVRTAWEGVVTEEATLDVADGLGEVTADPEAFRRLLENLFRNAVDHGGSAVSVRVGPLEEGAGFYVGDDGPGIPAENREEVFDVGFTTRSEGDGLGLAIVEGIASAHDWTVTITENEDGGARFEISPGA